MNSNYVIKSIHHNEYYQIMRLEDRQVNIICPDKSLMFQTWLSSITPYDNNDTIFQIKRQDGLFNLITIDKQLLFDEWLQDIDYITDDVAAIRRTDNTWNIADRNGNLYFKDEWLLSFRVYYKKYIEIESLDYKCNLIDLHGNLQFSNWFCRFDELISNFYIAVDEFNYKRLIMYDGEFRICDGFYRLIGYDGFKHIKVENKSGLWNYIDMSGNIISPKEWFKYLGDFWNGCARIQGQNGLWNYINEHGDIISPNQWFIQCKNFHNGFACVQRHDRLWNLIDKKGASLSKDMWLEYVEDFSHYGHTIVRRLGMEYNPMDGFGNIICPTTSFKSVFFDRESDLFIVAREDGMWNIIDKQGKFLSPKLWFNYITCSIGDMKCYLKKTIYYFDCKRRLHCKIL